MLEVAIALVVLLVVLVPVSGLLATVFRVGANARYEQAATAIATGTLDNQLLTGPSTLLGVVGDHALPSVTSAGQTYTLEREVSPYQPGNTACVSPDSTAEAMLKVVVWATWADVPASSTWWIPGTASATGSLVQESSLVAVPATVIDPTKGSILVSIKGALGQGQPDVTVTATPPTGSGAATLSATTTTAGCALFPNVVTGSWTVSASAAGYIDGQDDWLLASDTAAPLNAAAIVTASATSTLAFTYDRAATVTPQYVVPAVAGTTPAPPAGVNALPISFYNSSLTIDPYVAAWPAEVFPFATVPSYDVVAGSCGTESAPDGASVDGQAVSLSAGGTASPVLQLVPIDVLVAHGTTLLSGATVSATVSNAAGTGADPNCPGTSSPLAMPPLTLGVTCATPGACAASAARVTWRRGPVLLLATGTSTTVTSSQNPSSWGQTVTFTGTVSCHGCGKQPSGSVTFTDGSTTLATVPLTVGGSSSTATDTVATLAVGAHTIKASYTPTGSYSSSSATMTQTVNGDATTTTATSVPNPNAYGTSAVITATVASSYVVPAGTVAFSDGSTTIPGCSAVAVGASGTATCTAANLSGGVHTLTAAYTPSSVDWVASSGSITQTVTAATTTTTLTAGADPVTFGSPETLTATVAAASGGPAIGSVAFFDGTTAIGAPVALVAGVATLTTSTLALGSHSLTAVFTPTNGNNFSSSTGALSLPVNPPPNSPGVLSGLPDGVWLISATYTSGGTTWSSANSTTRIVVTVTAAGVSVNGGAVIPTGSPVLVPVQ